MMDDIHTIARLCTAHGIAYEKIPNPRRAVPSLHMALTIDARCMEALDCVIHRRLLTHKEEKEWISSLNFGSGNEEMMGGMGISWLGDAYLARLRGSGAGVMSFPPTTAEHSKKENTDNANGDSIVEASPVHRLDLHLPSMLSLGSPDFAGGAATGRGGTNQATTKLPTDLLPNQQ